MSIEQIARDQARKTTRRLAGLPVERPPFQNCSCGTTLHPYGMAPMGPDPEILLDAERIRLLGALSTDDWKPPKELFPDWKAPRKELLRILPTARAIIRQKSPHLQGDMLNLAVGEALCDPEFQKLLKEQL